MGINYVPSVTMHAVELWQEDTWPEVIRSVRREFELMEEIGLNGVRMFLPFHIWYHEREAFLDRMDRFLEELDRRKITMMPVIFNDCVGFGRPADITPHMTHGWQKYDIGHHGGHKENPFTGRTEEGGLVSVGRAGVERSTGGVSDGPSGAIQKRRTDLCVGSVERAGATATDTIGAFLISNGSLNWQGAWM